MINFTPEMIEKAKAAKSAEELLALAKENNVEMTEEEAKAYYAQINPASGELADDELDNVAGGGCGSSKSTGPQKYYTYYTNGMNIVSGGRACAFFTTNGCMGQYHGKITFTSSTSWYCTCSNCGAVFNGSGNPKDMQIYPDNTI